MGERESGKDTTLIGTTVIAQLIGRTPQRVRQLIADGVFKTVQKPAKDLLVERWEVEAYAELLKGTKRSLPKSK